MEKKEEFSSDQVKLSMTTNEGCQVEFQATATPEIVKKARKKAIKSIAKEVSIPGFRKGKAPDNLIEKNYAEPLDARWQKQIADTTFIECEKLANVPVLRTDSPINFKMEKFSLEEGATMTFNFEREPLIPEIPYSALTLEKKAATEITEEAIDKKIEEMQFYFAEWNEITDRAAQDNDYVTVDVENIEGKDAEKALSDARFEVSKEKMAGWMKDLVTGMKSGDSKEGVSKPDDDASEQTKKEMPATKVRLTLKKIELPTLPEVNDEFAKKVGAEDTAMLRTNTKNMLENDAAKEQKQKLRSQVTDLLLEKVAFDLPKSIMDQEISYRLKQAESDPNLAEKLKNEKEKVEEDIRKHGMQAIRLYYLSRKIASEGNIQISPDDLHTEELLPFEFLISGRNPKDYLDSLSAEQQNIVFSRLMLIKAQDYVIGKVLNA